MDTRICSIRYPNAYRPARAWERLAARVVDVVLWAGLIVLGSHLIAVAYLIYVVLHMDDQGTHDAQLEHLGHTVAAVSIAAAVVGVIVSDMAATAHWGGSLGKRALGLGVVHVADGSPAGPRAIVVRTAVLFAGSAASIVSIVWGGKQLRGWHDRAAGTVVRKTPPKRR